MTTTASRIKLTQLLMEGRRKAKPQLAEAAKKKRWNVHRGDTVQVISHRHPEKGKQGTVLKVDRKADRVVVSGVSLHPSTIPADQSMGQTRDQTVMRERSMHRSNVNLSIRSRGFPREFESGCWRTAPRSGWRSGPGPSFPGRNRRTRSGPQRTMLVTWTPQWTTFGRLPTTLTTTRARTTMPSGGYNTRSPHTCQIRYSYYHYSLVSNARATISTYCTLALS